MVDTIYIEKSVLEHEQTEAVLRRYPKAKRIDIDRYGEVLNSHNQNFRQQKNNPSLILAEKRGKRVFEVPAAYETGGGAHYYFSHMLNCIYDCRYCFLQGMLRSANYLLFVNYADFVADIQMVASDHQDDERPTWFFSGYDCDSLAYEPVTRFADYFIPAFADIKNSVLELRTKSTQIRSLLNSPVHDNVVVAFSLSPDRVARHVEHGAPELAKRLQALKRLQQAGWRIGLRFDPVVWHREYLVDYQQAFEQTFALLEPSQVENVTIGGFRLPKDFYKKMVNLYPEHWLLSAGLQEHQGLVSYRAEIEYEVLSQIEAISHKYMSPEKVFVYRSQDENSVEQPDK